MLQDNNFKNEADPIQPSSVLRWNWISISLVTFFTINSVLAEGALTERPAMEATALSTAPELDGTVLGDPAWQGVIPASGFWQVQPDEGQAATQKT